MPVPTTEGPRRQMSNRASRTGRVQWRPRGRGGRDSDALATHPRWEPSGQQSRMCSEHVRPLATRRAHSQQAPASPRLLLTNSDRPLSAPRPWTLPTRPAHEHWPPALHTAVTVHIGPTLLCRPGGSRQEEPHNRPSILCHFLCAPGSAHSRCLEPDAQEGTAGRGISTGGIHPSHHHEVPTTHML